MTDRNQRMGRTEPEAIFSRGATVEGIPRVVWFERIGVVVLWTTALLGSWELFSGDLDAQLATVTLVTVGVSVVGIVLVMTVPRVFGLARVTMGGAFVASMNVLLLAGLPTTFANVRDESPTEAVTFVVAILTSYSCVVFGLMVAEMGPRKRRVAAPERRVWSPYVWLLVFLGAATLAAYTVVAWPPAVLRVIGGSREAELAGFRAGSLALLEPAILRYMFSFVRIIVLPFVAAVFMIRALQRPTVVRWILAGGLAVLALFAAVANVEKSVVPRTLLIIILAYSLAMRGPMRRGLVVGGLGAAAGIPILIAQQSNSASTSTFETIRGLLRRVVVLPSEVVFEYFRWTNEHGHVFGATLPYVSYFVPGGPVAMSTIVYEYAFASRPGQVGSANGAYVAYLWADFGWPGIVLGSFVVAVVLAVLERVIGEVGTGPAALALRCVAFVQAAQLPSTSLTSSLLVLPFGLIDLVVLVAGWHLLARTGRLSRLSTDGASVRRTPAAARLRSTT